MKKQNEISTIAAICIWAPVATGARIVGFTIVVPTFENTKTIAIMVTITTTFCTGLIVITTAPIGSRITIARSIGWWGKCCGNNWGKGRRGDWV